MRNPRIVAHENPGASKPACQFIEVVDPNRALQRLFRPAKPVYGHASAQPGSQALKHLHRRALPGVAGKWMDHRRCPFHRRAGDSRKSRRPFRPELHRLTVVEFDRVPAAIGKGGQKLKGQPQFPDQFPELRPIRPIPGNHRIESAQALNNVCGGQKSEPIQSGRDNGLGSVCEVRQRHVLSRAPDFCVTSPKRFHRRQAQNEVADGPRPNQKTSQMNPNCKIGKVGIPGSK